MILVVEGERASYGRLAELMGSRDLALAATVTEARHRLESTVPTAMVLGRGVDDATASLLADVRAGRFDQPGLPVLAVTDGERDRHRAEALGVDETIEASVEEPVLEAAIERVVVLGRYKHAIREFFDVCHGRAEEPGERSGRPTGRPSLREARTEADAWLAEIQAHEGSFPIERLIDGD